MLAASLYSGPSHAAKYMAYIILKVTIIILILTFIFAAYRPLIFMNAKFVSAHFINLRLKYRELRK